jgi:hypothetical protein
LFELKGDRAAVRSQAAERALAELEVEIKHCKGEHS